MATVTGLSGNYYMVNNDIWVDVKGLSANHTRVKVEITEQAVDVDQELAEPQEYNYYPINGEVEFNLSPIIKGMLKEPNLQVNGLANGASIKMNYGLFQVKIILVVAVGSGSNFTFSKTFIRGGDRSNRQNVASAAGVVLKESTLIPRWEGYPVRKFYLGSGIQSTAIIPAGETVQRRVLGCDPIYLMFLNSKGGYSYWLFENFVVDNGGKGGDIIKRRDFKFQLTKDTEHIITVSGRVEREYYRTMIALIESPEVYVYRGEEVLFLAPASFSAELQGTWVRIFNQKNKFPFNNYDDLEDVNFKFSTHLNHDPSLV
jgi:hypothetical protein